MQDEARWAPSPRIGAQPLQIVLQQRLADRLIGVLPILLVVVARQHALDHAPHIIGEKRFESAPAALGIPSQQLDQALRQQIAHHERHVDAHACAPVITLEPREPIGA